VNDETNTLAKKKRKKKKNGKPKNPREHLGGLKNVDAKVDIAREQAH
jgi:hypothetical protein